MFYVQLTGFLAAFTFLSWPSELLHICVKCKMSMRWPATKTSSVTHSTSLSTRMGDHQGRLGAVNVGQISIVLGWVSQSMGRVALRPMGNSTWTSCSINHHRGFIHRRMCLSKIRSKKIGRAVIADMFS